MKIQFDWKQFKNEEPPLQTILVARCKSTNSKDMFIVGTYNGLRDYADTKCPYFLAKQIKTTDKSVSFGSVLIYDVHDISKWDWDFWNFNE